MIKVTKLKNIIKPFFFILIGIMPLLLKSGLLKKNKIAASDSSVLNSFSGNWEANDDSFELTIDTKPKLSINGKELDLTVISNDNDKIIFQDKYGYHISLTRLTNEKIELFDEAEDRTYNLYKNAESA